MAESDSLPAGGENFASLLEESLRSTETFEHTVAKGASLGSRETTR